MAADQLLLPEGTRLLHIGPHKTGTTAVQGAFHLARQRLAEHGVAYAGRDRQALLAALAVTNRPPLLGGPLPKAGHWDALVQDVQQSTASRVVISSEFFADTGRAALPKVVEALGGDRIHIVVTLRPLVKIIPSQWQQYLQNGFRMPYLEWLEGILKQPPDTPTPGFWHRHRHDGLVARWVKVVGQENLTVIVADETDRMMLPRTFEALVGLPEGFLVPERDLVNRSLTLAEAEVVRLLNEEFKSQGWPARYYSRFMRYGAVERMKAMHRPLAAEPKIVTPPWALKRITEISADVVENIAASGVRIIGDLSTLSLPPADADESEPAAAPGENDTQTAAQEGAPLIPADAAAQAVVGAFIAARMGAKPTEDTLREVDARTLARVLARRGRQRMRRALQINRQETAAEAERPLHRSLMDID